ncbi:MAG: hypothetical protein WC877_04625 [Dehalococcoidales bacterium]|jgi:hypothetical protein
MKPSTCHSGESEANEESGGRGKIIFISYRDKSMCKTASLGGSPDLSGMREKSTVFARNPDKSVHGEPVEPRGNLNL